MPYFRKKPVVIEAIKYEINNLWPVRDWINRSGGYAWLANGKDIAIRTLEGTMTAELGDWIIRGVEGEFYPCKPDIFEATYEEVSRMRELTPNEQQFWCVMCGAAPGYPCLVISGSGEIGNSPGDIRSAPHVNRILTEKPPVAIKDEPDYVR